MRSDFKKIRSGKFYKYDPRQNDAAVPEVVQATLEKIGIFQSHTLLAAHLETVHIISTGAHLYIRNTGTGTATYTSGLMNRGSYS